MILYVKAYIMYQTTLVDNNDVFCERCSVWYVNVVNRTLSIVCSFIDRGREYNCSRKDADRRLQNARYSECKLLDSPAGWPGRGNKGGAGEIDLSARWRSGGKPANLTRISQSESIDLSDVNPDKTFPFERNQKIHTTARRIRT